MKADIYRVDWEEAWDLLYSESIAILPNIQQDTILRAMKNSTHIWVGADDGKVIAVWGLIPPTLMSDTAYLWLFTTKHFTSHVFMFVRHSQRAIQSMLEEFPHICGHGVVAHSRSLRWLHWLGAEFGEPQGPYIPFTIRKRSWPQDSVQSA